MSNDFSNESITKDNFWDVLISQWKFLIIMIIGGIIAIVVALFVLLWYIDNSAIGGFGTWSIDQFTIGNIVFWIIMLVIFEILLVGIPALIILGGIALLWWRSLTPKDKAAFGRDDTGSKKRGTGWDGFSFIASILFVILIFLGGNLDTPLGDLSYRYLIHTYLLAMIILCIPLVIGGLIWFFYWLSQRDR